VWVVLRWLYDARLYLKLLECEFNAKCIRFVGVIVSPKRVKVKPDSINTITKLPLPKSYYNFQVLLGFANFTSDSTQIYQRLQRQ
jgi:hypothetical protein